MKFYERMQPLAAHSVFSLSEQGFTVWCSAMTQGEDGLYYLYFSFWPQDRGFSAWVTHSKIGYAVSDSPTGPFEYRGIILSGAGGNAWDRDCVHNPAVLRVNGIYYLYYMGNYGSGEYWDHRNHQRIGCAWAKHPEGPFHRLDAPVIDVTPGGCDALVTSNPAVCIGPDGKIYMLYKAVGAEDPLPRGGPVVCAMAAAEHPLGPFVKNPAPIFVNPEASWSVEDPCLFYEKDRFYAVVKDFTGYFSHAEQGAAALFESFDGYTFRPCAEQPAYHRILEREDGTQTALSHLERPQVLMLNGRPAVFCCTCCRADDPDKKETFCAQIALREMP